MDGLNCHTRAARGSEGIELGVGAQGTWEQQLPALVWDPFEGVLMLRPAFFRASPWHPTVDPN